MSSVMIVAAEASSSLFATRLLQHWKKARPELKTFGVGNNAMEAMGFERLGVPKTWRSWVSVKSLSTMRS